MVKLQPAFEWAIKAAREVGGRRTTRPSMVFFAFSGVEARDGPGTERLMLGGEMQARAGGLQPWIMARKTTRLIPLLERSCT